MTKKKSTRKISGIDRLIKFQIDDGIESLTIGGKETLADLEIDKHNNVTLHLNADKDKVDNIQSLIPFVKVEQALSGEAPNEAKEFTLKEDLRELNLIIDNSDILEVTKEEHKIEISTTKLKETIDRIFKKLEAVNLKADNNAIEIAKTKEKLNEEVTRLDNELLEVNGFIDELEKTVEANKNDIVKLVEITDKIEAKLKDVTTDLTNLTDEVTSLSNEAEIDKLNLEEFKNNTNKALSKIVIDFHDQNEVNANNFDLLKENVKSINIYLQNVNDSIDLIKLTKADNDDLNEVKAKVTDLEANTVNKTALTELSDKVTELETNKADKTDLTDLSNKVTEIETNKADKTALTELSDKVTEIETNKADKTSVDDLTGKVTDLETNKADKTSVTDLTSKVTDLETNKADKTTLTGLTGKVADLETNKADKTTVTDLTSKVTELETNKADKTALTDLSDKVLEIEANKTDSEAITNLSNRVKDLEFNKADVNYIDNSLVDLYSNKADKEEVSKYEEVDYIFSMEKKGFTTALEKELERTFKPLKAIIFKNDNKKEYDLTTMDGVGINFIEYQLDNFLLKYSNNKYILTNNNNLEIDIDKIDITGTYIRKIPKIYTTEISSDIVVNNKIQVVANVIFIESNLRKLILSKIKFNDIYGTYDGFDITTFDNAQGTIRAGIFYYDDGITNFEQLNLKENEVLTMYCIEY